MYALARTPRTVYPLLAWAVALVLVGFGAPTAVQAAVGADGWTSEFDEDGMVVSSRDAPGSSIREVRIVADVDAPALSVRNVVADHERAPEVIPRVAESRVLARDGNVAWVYQRLDVPVISDRDYTTRVVEERLDDSGGYRIRFEASTDRGPPPRAGVVRVERVRGAWEFLPVEGGSRTRVTYTVVVDPGGIIPAFVANIAARTAVPDVIRALRRWAASPRYAGERP